MAVIIPVKPKSSSTPGSVPTTTSVALGEIAINTYDGKLFAHINSGSDAIIQLAGPTVISGDATGTGYGNVTLTLASVATAGTATKVTYNAKGLVTSGTALGNSDVTSALGYTPVNNALVGAASGIATLDSTGKLTTAQIPSSLVGAVVYQGTWNASTNSPALASGTGTKGFYYKVATAGTTTLDGISSWGLDDTAIFDGTYWDKIDGQTSEVVSVAGMTGAVTLATTNLTDVSATAPTANQVFQYTSGKWTPTTLPAGNAGTVTSVTSTTSAITVATGTTTPALTFVPGSVTLASLGGSLTASQIAPAGTNGYTLQTSSGATTWVPASTGLVGSATPLVNGTATAGTALVFSSQDHVHPIDTSRAPLASPTFTGTVTIPAGAAISGYLTTSSASSTYAPLASPALTGTPTAPTATAGTSTTQLATTAFVSTAGYLTTSSAASTYAPIASPTFTGIPAGPTASAGTNTTQLATTAFVSTAITASANYSASSVAITGGSINGTTIGATTPSTGQFTTLGASGLVSFSNGLVRTLSAVTAAGTTLATGTALSSYYNNVTSGTGGVVLPLASTGYNQVGSDVWIFNRSGVQITVYPDVSGDTIELGTAGAGVLVPNGGDVRFTKTTSTNWASHGADSGFFSTLTVSGSSTLGTVTSTGINSSPIGATTPSTASFTTLTASSTVSGAGFVALHASPGPIGSTTPSTGAFTTGSFSGVLTAPTATAGTNTTQVATTAFVSAAGYLTTSSAASTYAPLASPVLTGTPTAPTATAGTATTQIATTAFVNNAGYLTTSNASSTYAPIASPTFTGTPAAPTATVGTSTTQLATTAFVNSAGFLLSSTAASTYAPIASPTFSGTVALGTATATAPSGTDNSSSVVTSAWVLSLLATVTGGTY
jgi:hypothetical protein